MTEITAQEQLQCTACLRVIQPNARHFSAPRLGELLCVDCWEWKTGKWEGRGASYAKRVLMLHAGYSGRLSQAVGEWQSHCTAERRERVDTLFARVRGCELALVKKIAELEDIVHLQGNRIEELEGAR